MQAELQFNEAIQAVINHYAMTTDITTIGMIGTLRMIEHILMTNAFNATQVKQIVRH